MTVHHRRGYRKRRDHRHNPVPVEAMLMAWVLTDISMADIARTLGCTRDTVQKKLLEARETGDPRPALGYAIRR